MPPQASTQATNVLQVVSPTQEVPAVVVHAEVDPIISCVVMHEEQADEGVPPSPQAEAQSVAQGAPEAQPQSASR